MVTISIKIMFVFQIRHKLFCVGKQFIETRVQPSANGSKAPWSLADMRQWPAHITKGYKAGKGIIRPLPDLMKESV